MNKICKEQFHLQNMLRQESQFKPIPGLRINYRYTIKVWLTSIILGTTLFFAYKIIRECYSPEGTNSDISAVFYYIIALSLAVILSVPSLLLFAAGYNFIAGYIYSSFRIKFMLSLMAQGLCWLSFYIGLGGSRETMATNLDLILPYAVAALISVIACRLSANFKKWV